MSHTALFINHEGYEVGQMDELLSYHGEYVLGPDVDGVRLYIQNGLNSAERIANSLIFGVVKNIKEGQ